MSIERLNVVEKAHYLIGVAVMRQLEQAPRDPDTEREIGAVCRWLDFWLTSEEAADMMVGTGLIVNDDLGEELVGHVVPTRDDSRDQDIPF